MDAACWVRLRDRGVLALGGAEARGFLQGLVSNDMNRLTPERAIYAALLTPQGKYLFDFILFERNDELLLDVEAARAGELAQRLAMYRLRAKVLIQDRSASLAVVALLGPGLPARFGLAPERGSAGPLGDGVVAIDPRLAALGARAILPDPERALDLPEAPPEAYERHRLQLGVPASSSDLLVQKSTLLESNFEALGGVDFNKGCYVGQELTARTKYRALVRKRLLPVRVGGPLPAPGTPLLLGGKDAGELRSGLGDRAMALVRLDALERWRQEGGPFDAGGTAVEPEWPGWLEDLGE
jgi:folate-binding protein YgfZ